MKYAVHMGSVAVPSFVKTYSEIRKLIGVGLFTDTQTAWRFHKSVLVYSKEGRWARNKLI
jgi:hypothetical protein